MKLFILGKADLWRSYQEMQPYFEMTWPPDHAFYTYVSWGVGHPERRGKAYIYAWLLTGNAKYRDSALLAMDNIAGCNAMGRSITTGLGKVSRQLAAARRTRTEGLRTCTGDHALHLHR